MFPAGNQDRHSETIMLFLGGFDMHAYPVGERSLAERYVHVLIATWLPGG